MYLVIIYFLQLIMVYAIELFSVTKKKCMHMQKIRSLLTIHQDQDQRHDELGRKMNCGKIKKRTFLIKRFTIKSQIIDY